MAIVEVLAGGALTLLGVYFTNKHSRDMADEAQQELLRGFLKGLYCELDTIYEIHRGEVGPMIDALKSGEPLLLFYPIGQNYFTVFDGNSELLGRVPGHDMRTAAIRAYMFSKSFVDTIHKNNELYDDFTKAILNNRQSPSEANTLTARDAYDDLCTYGEQLKKSQKRAYAAVDHFIGLAKARGFQPAKG